QSLLKVNPGNSITEVTDEFTHLGFSKKYRIKALPKVYTAIQKGLSDWVVGKSLLSKTARYDDNYTVESAEFEVEVQYNVWNNTYDRVVLVIYAMDADNKWHVKGTYVDGAGNITFSESINDNSKSRVEPLKLQTSQLFIKEDGIWQVKCELIPLNPGDTKVSLTPSANFTLPQ
ncbi:MAG: hypothetical protein L3J69_18440, partial [Desulfobacula sp.]|nr:hypothetical protein [Desulfobacula sp.]